MRMALGIMFILMATSCLYIASHGLEAASPWSAFQSILNRAVTS